MKLEQIEVIIEPNGKIRLQTSGFSGDECLAATDEIETLLGGQIIERERTAENFEQTHGKTAEKIRIGNGR